MPRVPTIDPGNLTPTRPLRPQPLNVQFSGEDFGAGIGRAASRYGQAELQHEMDKADEVATMAAANRAREYFTNAQYGPDGFLNKTGKDAFTLTEPVLTGFDNEIGKIEMELTNDRQRAIFRRQASAMRADMDVSVQRHVAQQIKQYDSDEFTKSIKLSVDRAVGNYTDPVVIAAEVGSVRNNAEAYFRRNGKGGSAQEKQFITDTVSAMHTAVIQRMLANEKDSMASEYYKAVSSFITGPDATTVEKAIEAGTLRQESQKKTDEIMSGRWDPAEINAEVKKITDPKLRDAVQQRVDAELSRRDRADRERAETMSTAFATQIDRGHSVASLRGTYEWQQLPVPVRASLESYAKQIESNGKTETDWTAFYDLLTLASTEATRTKWLKTNLMEYRGKLSDTEFKQLSTLQASMRGRDEKQDTTAVLQGMRTNMQIVNDSLAAVGIDPTPKGKGPAARVALFRRQVDELIIKHKMDNGGRAPSDVEVQKMVDDLLVQGKVKGSGIMFEDRVFAFEAPKDKIFAVSVKDIPVAEAATIRRKLRERGLSTTDADVVRLYNIRLRSLGVPTELPDPKSQADQIPK